MICPHCSIEMIKSSTPLRSGVGWELYTFICNDCKCELHQYISTA